MCVSVCLNVCATRMPGAWEGQQKVSESLKLQLQIAASHHVDAGVWTQVNRLSSFYFYSK